MTIFLPIPAISNLAQFVSNQEQIKRYDIFLYYIKLYNLVQKAFVMNIPFLRLIAELRGSVFLGDNCMSVLVMRSIILLPINAPAPRFSA